MPVPTTVSSSRSTRSSSRPGCRSGARDRAAPCSSAQARASVERANLELLEQTLTDELTGLRSRRRMEDDLARAHAPCRRRVGRTYGVALFDIDHFSALQRPLRARRAGTRRCAVSQPRSTCRTSRGVRLSLRRGAVPPPHAGLPTHRLHLHDRGAHPSGRGRGRHPSRRPTVFAVVGDLDAEACRAGRRGRPLTPDEVLEEAGEALVQAKSDGRNRVYAAPSVDGIVDQVPVFTALQPLTPAQAGTTVRVARRARRPSDVCATNSSSRAGSPRQPGEGRLDQPAEEGVRTPGVEDLVARVERRQLAHHRHGDRTQLGGVDRELRLARRMAPQAG